MTMRSTKDSFEIVLVNDGSKDRSAEVLVKAIKANIRPLDLPNL